MAWEAAAPCCSRSDKISLPSISLHEVEIWPVSHISAEGVNDLMDSGRSKTRTCLREWRRRRPRISRGIVYLNVVKRIAFVIGSSDRIDTMIDHRPCLMDL